LGITIGAHGRHHICLPLHDEGAQRSEVQAGKRWLEAVVGQQVRCFAYPYGERDGRTVRVLRESGFTIGVTVDERPVEDGCPRLLLPRCEVTSADIGTFISTIGRMLGAP